MSLESYFAGLLTSCSNNIICIKIPLSFVVFLIYDRVFLPVILGVEKTIPCDTWFSLVVFGDEVCCLQEQRAALLNPLMRIIWLKSREKWRKWTRNCLIISKSWVGHLKRLSGSRVWTNKASCLLSSEAVQRLTTGCCECNTQLYMDSVAVQWLLQTYRHYRYRKHDLQLNEY